MINRYQGNSGRVTRIEEPQQEKKVSQDPAPVNKHVNPRQQKSNNQHPQKPVNTLGDLLGKLAKLIPGGTNPLSKLETEDIILLLILYLMYRESGDSELLMIMGAMLLM